LPNRFFNDTAAGFNLSWELDFWGRFRRGVEAATAELEASIENYDDATVILIAEVATAYVQLRVFQERIKYIDKNIEYQKGFVQQAEDRLKGGAGRRVDVGQQRSNLSDTQALREQGEIGVRLANNQLCILLGFPVRDLVSEKLGKADVPGWKIPPEVAVGMPVDLLRRRPDLRRAERQVAAQSARVGIATSNLYPRISLIGTLGYESENFKDLFTSKSFIGSVGPSVRWDILNYGRLVNGIREQDAILQTAVFDYQNAVLSAGREVEDSLVLFLRSQRRTRELTESAKQAEIAVEEVLTLSKDVKFDLNQAFVTSNFLVQQQDKLAQSRGDIAFGFIQIYKALGGGWEIRNLDNCPPVVPAERVEPIPPPQKMRVEPIPAPQNMLPPVNARFLTPQVAPASK
jgi:NodT family efflux transporter outer membrane factor (OMF) lipoprotein